jgi:rhodanese-related sulfurtransferase
MDIHELNPWRTLIALSIFIVILIVGFFTMHKPIISFEKDMNQSLADLKQSDMLFYPWQLESFINKQDQNIVLFDIRDKFIYGQGNIPGSENISAHDLTMNESIERLKELKDKNITVVLYGNDQLEANGPCMLFRQVGFVNVKVLAGGYQFYAQHKDNLTACKNNTTLIKGKPHYDFANIASQMGGEEENISSTDAKKPVVVTRKVKVAAAAGGC